MSSNGPRTQDARKAQVRRKFLMAKEKQSKSSTTLLPNTKLIAEFWEQLRKTGLTQERFCNDHEVEEPISQRQFQNMLAGKPVKADSYRRLSLMLAKHGIEVYWGDLLDPDEPTYVFLRQRERPRNVEFKGTIPCDSEEQAKEIVEQLRKLLNDWLDPPTLDWEFSSVKLKAMLTPWEAGRLSFYPEFETIEIGFSPIGPLKGCTITFGEHDEYTPYLLASTIIGSINDYGPIFPIRIEGNRYHYAIPVDCYYLFLKLIARPRDTFGDYHDSLVENIESISLSPDDLFAAMEMAREIGTISVQDVRQAIVSRQLPIHRPATEQREIASDVSRIARVSEVEANRAPNSEQSRKTPLTEDGMTDLDASDPEQN